MRGQAFFIKSVGIKFLKNNLSASRFAVVAGLKVSKRSTIRNRIKRQIREALRKHINEIKLGFDVVVSARGVAQEKESEEIEKNLLYALGASRLLQN